jgi:hypothetical protein
MAGRSRIVPGTMGINMNALIVDWHSLGHGMIPSRGLELLHIDIKEGAKFAICGHSLTSCHVRKFDPTS